MRQNSKNNRSRGRGRKGPNPLTRSYESNGPDVKVRGTAQHVAEKYQTLARDALSSGDGIAAENYFQHAEHYNRIIMTAQQAQQNAAREEERRQQLQQPADNNEQPTLNNNEQPAVQSRAQEPQPVRSAEVGDGDQRAKNSDSPGEETEPKTRRRRQAPRRPRPAETNSDDNISIEKEEKIEGEKDNIGENPPAFLMSD